MVSEGWWPITSLSGHASASVPFSVCNPNREDLQQVSSQVQQWRLSANKQSFWQTEV